MKVAVYILAVSLMLAGASDALPQAMPEPQAQQPPAPPSSAEPDGQPQQPPAPAADPLEDVEQRIEALKVKDQLFTIVLHKKRVRDVGEETVARMEILDQTGNIAYAASFPFELDGDQFVETTEVSARLLDGSHSSGILVNYGIEPSTPLGGGSYQVFGLFNGKLAPFSKPISFEGDLVQPEPPPEKVVQTTTEPGRQGDVLQFRVWTGNFFVIVPVLVDWMQAKMVPAWRCTRITARGPQPQCTFKVEANRIQPETELTFVRLHHEPEEMGPPERVVVKKTSKVEFLEAAGPQVWQEDTEGVALSVGDDLWLKVRIDGEEGWIHTQEDFTAIGLPQTG